MDHWTPRACMCNRCACGDQPPPAWVLWCVILRAIGALKCPNDLLIELWLSYTDLITKSLVALVSFLLLIITHHACLAVECMIKDSYFAFDASALHFKAPQLRLIDRLWSISEIQYLGRTQNKMMKRFVDQVEI